MEEDHKPLGDILKEAREARALSLAEVEAHTRIRAKFLEALERGDIGELPSQTHARGFLRNYAQFLGLDVREVIDRFGEMTGTAPAGVTRVTTNPRPAPPPPMPAQQTESQSPSPHEVDETTGAPPAVPPPPGGRSRYVPPTRQTGPAAPMGITQRARPLRRDRQETGPRPQPVQPEKERGQAAKIIRSPWFSAAVLLTAAVVVGWWLTSRLSALGAEEQAEIAPAASEDTSITPDAGLGISEGEETSTSTPTPSQENTEPLIVDRVLLEITVVQRTWTVIDVDGQRVFEGQASAGELLEYTGEDEIRLRTGNGAGLLVTYNGQELGALGERGEVVERTFTTESVIEPTPTPTITPTSTPVPSPTPRFTATPDNDG